MNEPVSVLHATVKVDAYVEQSLARVERFDGDRWQEVVSQPCLAFDGTMPLHVTREDDTCQRAASKIVEPLIDLTARIIAEARSTKARSE